MMNLLGKVAVFLNFSFSVMYLFKIDDSMNATFLGSVGIIGVIPTDTFIGTTGAVYRPSMLTSQYNVHSFL